MNGIVNGQAVNNRGLPNWVVRVVAVAAVAAAASTVAPTRKTYSTAFTPSGAVVVTLSDFAIVQARATSTAAASSFAAATKITAARVNTTASAFGAGSVRRDVFGHAGADAGAYGEALVASTIGNASNNASSTVVLAKAHIVFPGRLVTVCQASAVGANALATRRPTATTSAGVAYTRGEASIKISPSTHYRLDGFVPLAQATCTGTITPDQVKQIVTLGTFDFGTSTATMTRTFLVVHGAAVAQGAVTNVLASQTFTQHAQASGASSASVTAVGVRVAMPAAAGQAASTSNTPKTLQRHATGCTVGAEAYITPPIGLRTTYGAAYDHCGARPGAPPFPGRQNWAESTSLAQGSLSANARLIFMALGAGEARSSTVLAKGSLKWSASVNATIASAMTLRAYAIANSEIPAPDDRSMRVAQDDRSMVISFADNVMRVPA